ASAPHLNSMVRHVILHIVDSELAKVKHTRGQNSIRTMLRDLSEITRLVSTARRNQRDPHLTTHRGEHLYVKALVRAISIHRIQQNLTSATLRTLNGPLNSINPRPPTPAMGRHLIP